FLPFACLLSPQHAYSPVLFSPTARPPPTSTLFPYTTLFRSESDQVFAAGATRSFPRAPACHSHRRGSQAVLRRWVAEEPGRGSLAVASALCGLVERRVSRYQQAGSGSCGSGAALFPFAHGCGA